MLLKNAFNTVVEYAGRRIRRITPCKRSAARGNKNPLHPQPRSGLNYYVVLGMSEAPACPELRFACKGLSTCKTFGLAFAKQSYKRYPFEHDFNLLK